jgi:hypothetical protein
MALACTLHSPASSSPGIKRSRARRVGSRLSALICRVEDAIRTGKDTGPGHFPSFDYGINAAWLTAAMTGQILLAWLRAPGPGRRPRQGRAQDTALPGAAHRHLKIQATWPWADAITAAWQRIDAIPQAP